MRNIRNLNLIRLSRKLRNMPHYAVAQGRRVGIYSTWDECKAQVTGFSGAKYKKFNSLSDAQKFIGKDFVGPCGNESFVGMKSGKDKPEENLKVPFVDFWPEDVSDGEEDDYFLASVAASIDPVKNAEPHKTKAQTVQPHSNGLIDMLKSLRRDSIVYASAHKKTYGGYQFPVDFNGFVLVYTDGACENNGRYNATAGLGVYFDDHHPLNASKPVTGRATNNTGEIQAACEAIRIAIDCKIDKLRINTDSQFLINSATMWIKSWKRKNWKLSDGSDVKNREDYMILDKLTKDSPIIIEWNYVKGHARIKGNERADRLAKDGALMYVRTKVPRKE